MPKLRRSRTSLTRGSRCPGLAHPRGRAVARAVVDEDDLEALAQPVEHRGHPRGQLRHRLRLVQHGDDDRDVELARLGRRIAREDGSGRLAGHRGRIVHQAPYDHPYESPPMQRFGSWAVLGLLLAATLAGALTFDRRSWPGLVGDEATYLMQAQSLAWDFDLRYSRRDYDRFVEQWGVKPDGLILQSGDGGRTLVYAKPAAYALWIAPFLRLSPTRGAAIANALLLALAAVLAARTLERRLGPAAPLWVAVWIFASVAFAYVFWAHADLFLMSLVAIALALAYGAPRAGEAAGDARPHGAALGRRRRSSSAWSSPRRPFYGTLLLPAALAVPAPRRRLGIAMLAAGAARRRPRLGAHPPGGGGLLDPLLRRAPELRRQDRLPRGGSPPGELAAARRRAGQPLLAARRTWSAPG